MNEQRHELPFKGLGERLKTIRQKLQESVADVSGAVEIDEKVLLRIERGSERPSEDILMLLINHFGMQDDEAAGLWQLAGYEQPRHEDRDQADDLPPGNRAAVLIMAVDPRVMYSDQVQVTANQSGVVMSFVQTTGPNQSMTTARIGMSREQARQLLHVLHTTLEKSEPKQLPQQTQKPTKEKDA